MPAFYFAGADQDGIYTWCPSWSGRDTEHDQIIWRDGTVECSCEDCQNRHKSAHIDTIQGAGCKHIRRLLPMIRKAREE